MMKAIIFIPGYKASKLMNKSNNKIVFPNLDNLFTKSPLEFDITKESNNLINAGIVDEISILFLKINIYKNFINTIKSLGENFKLFNFDFDWRLDFIDHIKRLDNFINDIKNQFENIYFISHSLGAYLLSYYLKYGIQNPKNAIEDYYLSEKIKKIVLISVPFKGSQVFLKDLYYNDGFLWNKKLFHKNISRTFPAVYQLLPQHKDPIIDENGNTIDLFDIVNWKENNFVFWGENQNNQNFMKIYEQFLEDQLKQAQNFYEKINNCNKPIPDYCKILNFIGTKQPTPKQYLWIKSKKKNKLIIKQDQYSKYPFIKNQKNTGD